jgi:transketolase
MVDYKKVIKDTLKEELSEFKEFYNLMKPDIKKTYKKNLQKQQRSESRIAQRTGNKYMIGKKTTFVKKKGKIQKARPRGRWKPEG